MNHKDVNDNGTLGHCGRSCCKPIELRENGRYNRSGSGEMVFRGEVCHEDYSSLAIAAEPGGDQTTAAYSRVCRTKLLYSNFK